MRSQVWRLVLLAYCRCSGRWCRPYTSTYFCTCTVVYCVHASCINHVPQHIVVISNRSCVFWLHFCLICFIGRFSGLLFLLFHPWFRCFICFCYCLFVYILPSKLYCCLRQACACVRACGCACVCVCVFVRVCVCVCVLLWGWIHPLFGGMHVYVRVSACVYTFFLLRVGCCYDGRLESLYRYAPVASCQ